MHSVVWVSIFTTACIVHFSILLFTWYQIYCSQSIYTFYNIFSMFTVRDVEMYWGTSFVLGNSKCVMYFYYKKLWVCRFCTIQNPKMSHPWGQYRIIYGLLFILIIYHSDFHSIDHSFNGQYVASWLVFLLWLMIFTILCQSKWEFVYNI